MIATLNDDYYLGVDIHKGVNILQQKKSYSDVLKSGTSSKLKNQPYKKDSITGRVTTVQVHLPTG